MSFSQVFILLSLVLVLISVVLYTQDLQWSQVNLSHCASSRYKAITPLHMGMFRTVCLGVILTTLIHIITTPVPLEVTVLLKDGSRLLVKSLHFNRCTFFTVWSWILMVCKHILYLTSTTSAEYANDPHSCYYSQGVYFLLSAYCSFTHHNDRLLPHSLYSPWLLHVTWILFEVSLPISYLVSCIVTYVLIPAAVQSKMPTSNFYKWYDDSAPSITVTTAFGMQQHSLSSMC
jgi:hypothetical protein